MKVTDDTVTEAQLIELFERHCECRPLDLTRGQDDHSHDCDTAILHDIQIALGIISFDDIGRIQAVHEARARCAKRLLWKKNRHGGWDVPSEESW